MEKEHTIDIKLTDVVWDIDLVNDYNIMTEDEEEMLEFGKFLGYEGSKEEILNQIDNAKWSEIDFYNFKIRNIPSEIVISVPTESGVGIKTILSELEKLEDKKYNELDDKLNLANAINDALDDKYGLYAIDFKAEEPYSKDKTRQILNDGVEKVLSSNEYQNFLEISKNLREMSPFNKYSLTVQAYMRGEDISLLKTAKSWEKDYERHINKGSKAYYVMKPNARVINSLADLEKAFASDYIKNINDYDNVKNEVLTNGKATILTSFSYIPEFDVKDTNGKELPKTNYMENINANLDNFDKIKEAIISTSDVPVEFKTKEEDNHLNRAYGYYSPMDNKIVVSNDDRSEQDQIKTLVHEIAHSKLHSAEMIKNRVDSGDERITKSIKEVEAETVAWLVCMELGIESDMRSFGYIADYLPNNADERNKALEKAFTVSDKCASEMIKGIEKTLKLSKDSLDVIDIKKDNKDKVQTKDTVIKE